MCGLHGIGFSLVVVDAVVACRLLWVLFGVLCALLYSDLAILEVGLDGDSMVGC